MVGTLPRSDNFLEIVGLMVEGHLSIPLGACSFVDDIRLYVLPHRSCRFKEAFVAAVLIGIYKAHYRFGFYPPYSLAVDLIIFTLVVEGAVLHGDGLYIL